MQQKLLVGLATALGMFVAAPAPTDACSIKLIGAQHSPRRAVARSSRPSNVLVVGDSPRLMRELSAKGHTVEVVTDIALASRHDYGAVVTDQQHEGLARKTFGTDHVVVRSGDVVNVLQSVESTLARKIVNRDKTRVAKDAKIPRTPTITGGGKTSLETPIASGGGTAGQETGTSTASISTGSTTGAETGTRKQQAVQAPTNLREQIYFGLGSTNVGRKTTIAKAVKWLGANASGTLVIEGHADPSGSPEANMVLSQHRADAVKEAIMAEGIDASRIEVQAFGDTKLEFGRTDGRNRRVTIKAKP